MWSYWHGGMAQVNLVVGELVFGITGIDIPVRFREKVKGRGLQDRVHVLPSIPYSYHTLSPYPSTHLPQCTLCLCPAPFSLILRNISAKICFHIHTHQNIRSLKTTHFHSLVTLIPWHGIDSVFIQLNHRIPLDRQPNNFEHRGKLG